jgi:hypothetical protein
MAQENFGVLTYLIDDFELKTFILGCRKHPNGASATELETQLTSDLTNWGFENVFFFSIVTHAASNMNSLGEKILSCGMRNHNLDIIIVQTMSYR